MDASITVNRLQEFCAGGSPPQLIDVRDDAAFAGQPQTIPHAIRRSADNVSAWAKQLEPWRLHVAYCVHGHEVSQGVAGQLVQLGIKAVYLEGGIEAWRSAGGLVTAEPASTQWVTRERPKVDRIACPWLIRRFIDPDAEFLFVPTDSVFAAAEEMHATPFDIPGAEYSHRGELCSFDTFIEMHGLHSPTLDTLAAIVRGADTARLGLAPQSAGLLAVSLGLSRILTDDHEMLHHGFMIYDALYAWCVEAQDEPHNWKPKT